MISETKWEKLFDSFRENPGAITAAARAASVSYPTARKAWLDGWEDGCEEGWLDG